MSYDALSEVPNPKIRRACFLAQKAAGRRLKTELESHEKRFHRNSKAFAQKILLYLSEESQKRHERETRTSRLTKMFGVPLDEAEMQLLVGSFKKQNEDDEIDKGKKKEPQKTSTQDDTKKQRSDLANTLASGSSNLSYDREETPAPDSSRRVRALSMDVLKEVSGSSKRRLSAPEVVITPVAKRSISSYSTGSSRGEEDKEANEDLSPPRLTPQTSISELEDSLVSPSSICPSESSPLRPPREKTDPLSSRMSSVKSSFKTYTRASPLLLKRTGSHDSTTNRKKPSKLEQPISWEEIQNPVQDQRFLDLLSSLHILPGHEETLGSPTPLTKQPAPKSTH